MKFLIMDWINYSAGRYGQKVDISLLKVLKVNQRIQNLQWALFVSWAPNTFKRAHPKEIPRFLSLTFPHKSHGQKHWKALFSIQKETYFKETLRLLRLVNFSNKLKNLCQIKGTQILNATKMLQILVIAEQFRLQVSSTSQWGIWRHMDFYLI